MSSVAVSGYVSGFCVKKNKEDTEYGIVDLLQFGAENQRSELIPLLVYDAEILGWIKVRYKRGNIYPGSFICSIISIPGKKEIMWVIDRVVEFLRKDIKQDVGVGSTTTD